MSDELIMEQEAPVNALKAKNLSDNKIMILIPAILAVIATMICYVTIALPFLVGLISYGFDFMEWNISNLISQLFSNTTAIITTLLLPVAVIIAKKVNKPVFTKVLLFVAIGFLAVQLVAAFVCFVFSFFNFYGTFWESIEGFFAGVQGSYVLSSLVYTVKDLFADYFAPLQIVGYCISDLLTFVAELLFILKNVLCALLCLLMLKKN